MARIAGVDLPKKKRVCIALTYIYGIGRSRAEKILSETNLDLNKKILELTEKDILSLREYIESNFKVEGEARAEVYRNIKRLMQISCYRGIRHKVGLPVRGQKTHTNARTRKRRIQRNVKVTRNIQKRGKKK